MSKRAIMSLLLGLLFYPLLLAQQSDTSHKVVGYLPYYRFPIIDQLQLDKLTHLCIAFANPDERGYLKTGGVNLKPVVERARRDSVKVMISLAGGALNEKEAAAWKDLLQPWNRPAFVQKIVRYLHTHNLDGVDVDLEWKSVDHNYGGFLRSLGRALHREGKLLSVAVPAKHRYKHLSRDVFRHVDFFNIMAYDLTGHWAPDRPGPHSPYHLAESALQYWKAQGLPAKKVVLGLPFYGWDFSNPSRVRSMNYAEIVELSSHYAQQDRMGEVYYNGLQTIIAKTELAMESAGGVMLWEIGRDDFGEHSLLAAVDRTLRGVGPISDSTRLASVPSDATLSKPHHRRDTLSAAVVEGDFAEEPLLKEEGLLAVELKPNPFQDSITITNHEDTLLTLVLTDAEGRKLHEADLLPNSTISWETSSFPQGFYTFSALVDGRKLSRRLAKRPNAAGTAEANAAKARSRD